MKESSYFNKMHNVGQVITIVAVLIFVAVPLIICLKYDIMPTFGGVMKAAGGILAIFIPTGLAEMFAEVPVMGSSYYVSCVTGNILNLKLPAAMNALKVADIRQGTEAADAVTGVAVAVSSMVTLVLLAIGVLLLTPLQPLLETPAVGIAAGNVLPALFGCLAIGTFSKDLGSGIIAKNKILGAAVPFALCIIAYIFIPDIYNLWQGVVMILCIPAVYICTKTLYKKGIIKVQLPTKEEKSGEAAE